MNRWQGAALVLGAAGVGLWLASRGRRRYDFRDRVVLVTGGVGTRPAKGKDSQSELSPSWLTRLTEEAAERNNEVAPAGA